MTTDIRLYFMEPDHGCTKFGFQQHLTGISLTTINHHIITMTIERKNTKLTE